jgi:hypothetical protein
VFTYILGYWFLEQTGRLPAPIHSEDKCSIALIAQPRNLLDSIASFVIVSEVPAAIVSDVPAAIVIRSDQFPVWNSDSRQ